MDVLADTTLLIDLWREQRRPGLATAFARQHENLSVGIPWVVAGEFLSGGIVAKHNIELLEQFLERYVIVQSTPSIIAQYAHLFAMVRNHNRQVGPNDLWIAACARALNLPLITRNASDFNWMADVTVMDYTGG